MSNMTAMDRYVLGYLAERPSRAFEVSWLATQLDKSIPKTQAALAHLRRGEFVNYYLGHPGAWAITAAGRAVIKGDTAPEPTERYRLALELIAELSFIEHDAPAKIARKALA